jgi:uncharacterized membrane protein
MPESIEQYTSPTAHSPFRRQAIRVWSITGTIAFLWILLIVAPPILTIVGFHHIGSPLFEFFGYTCHQIPERSFRLDGKQLAVCSRCFGVYFGLLVGVLVYPIWRQICDIEPLPRIWLFVAMIPIGIDWSLTIFGIWENTHLTRFVTGLILGAACATYIMPAIIEIVRYSTKRQKP